MTTTKLLRHINAARCLRLLHDGRSLTRADIARELGLTRATIGNAMNVLMDGGYVTEGNVRVAEGRGRPGVAVTLDPTGAYFIGVDIGTRVLTAVLVDLRMKVVSRIVDPIGPRYRDPEYILERLLVLVQRVIVEARVPGDRIEGLCVSVPGIVSRSGCVVNAPFLEWRDYALRERLVERCDVDWRVIVCNDAFAFANAETSSHSDAVGDNVLLVLMAEGIGGAFIEAGRSITGSHGYAGEIGHMVVTVRDRTDTFELLAGGKSFDSLFEPYQTVAEGVDAMLSTPDSPAVASALEAWAEVLAAGFANAVHLLDPGRIVLGGPVSALYPLVATSVGDMLADRLLPGFKVPPVIVAKLGADGAAIGAAATMRETIFSLPDIEQISA